VAVTIVDSARPVVGGVDTHRDVNVAAVVHMNGGLLGVESFPTTAAGHRCLSSWMSGFGAIDRVGIEGTGAYGAGIARQFLASGVVVIEVDRPDRQKRRRHGKSDQLDAVEAARGALSGRCAGRAKSGDAHAEALRALLVAKRSARSTRIRTIVQLRHLMFTAPDELRQQLAGRKTSRATSPTSTAWISGVTKHARSSITPSFTSSPSLSQPSISSHKRLVGRSLIGGRV
jgi:transposase